LVQSLFYQLNAQTSLGLYIQPTLKVSAYPPLKKLPLLALAECSFGIVPPATDETGAMGYEIESLQGPM
jgi:hypothetical protein